VIAVSEGIARAAVEAGVDAERLHVVGGAVDVERFHPGRDGRAIRAELGLADAPVVGCVARLVPGRGHELLLDATRRLRERLRGVRLLLVGRGEGQPAVERRARELALDDVVVFAGYREDDLPDVLAAMDCFVLLGGGSEESGRAVLEAMAVGRPVVTGRFGAMPETVVDGETGWLVDGALGAQADAVADRLASVLTDPTRARAFGAAARRRVESLFTPERRAAAVEAVYQRVLRRPLSASRRPRAWGFLGRFTP
jgi:phosphatidylinositol alpha-1,6-mannosyltransferase